MKKQFLSLLLVLLFVPSIFLFVGCGEESYKLTKLESDYCDIVENCDNIKIENNKIIFDYSNHKLGNNAYLVSAINVEPYNQLNNYNTLFDNLMGFTYEYIDVCSNKNIEASATTRNSLKKDLDELSIALNDVDTYINQWAEVIEFHYNDDITNEQCLARFKTLLSAYNNLYQTSINFSNGLASLYYNNALNDSNPRIDNVELADFDSSVIISKLQSRVKYQVSNLSQVFVEKFVDGRGLETIITTKDEETELFEGELDLNQNDYLDKVDSIERVFGAGFDAETAVTIANGASKKETFYNYSVQAYNLQNIIENDNEMFISACNKVVYGKANLDVDQVKYKEIIDDYSYVVNEYNEILSSMINLMGL